MKRTTKKSRRMRLADGISAAALVVLFLAVFMMSANYYGLFMWLVMAVAISMFLFAGYVFWANE